MLSEATSGLKVAAGRTRSSTVIQGAPPVVMFTMQSERCRITGRKREGLGSLVGPASLGDAGVEMDDGGARLGRSRGGLHYLLGRDRQVRRHRGRVDRPVTAHVMITLRASAMGQSPISRAA